MNLMNKEEPFVFNDRLKGFNVVFIRRNRKWLGLMCVNGNYLERSANTIEALIDLLRKEI